VMSTLRFFRQEYLELLKPEAQGSNGEARRPVTAAK
jgi:hypothetical protein